MSEPAARLAIGASQRTILRSVFLSGSAGFHAAPARVELRPVAPWSGIQFELAGEVLNVQPHALYRGAQHTTALEMPSGRIIHTVEHLLAAVCGLGLTNMRIVVAESGHIPFLDGSAAPFVEAILRAGIHEQEQAALVAEVCSDLTVRSANSVATVRPCRTGQRGLFLNVTIDFPEPIGRQRLTYTNGPTAFALELARARTFLSVPWTGQLVKALPGFRRQTSPYPDANMIVHDGKKFLVDFRLPDECARHKALDLVGDLGLLGLPLIAEIDIVRPGHKFNHLLVRAIATAAGISAATSDDLDLATAS
jgi:UDP-3-O-[3-hydroxymyristoyl] N-acetylglucosamine deacetylase